MKKEKRSLKKGIPLNKKVWRRILIKMTFIKFVVNIFKFAKERVKQMNNKE